MADEPLNDEMKEIVQDFLVESQEVLDGLDQRFVALEKTPDDADLLNEIFRAAHSMKGSAGFLGFTRLVDVAHHTEGIMNKMRQREMAVERSVVDTVLAAFDVIKLLLHDIRETGSDAHVDVSDVVHKLVAVLEQDTGPGLLAQGTTVIAKPLQNPGTLPLGDGALVRETAHLAAAETRGSEVELPEATAQQEASLPIAQDGGRDKVASDETPDKALNKQGIKSPASEEDQTIRVETRRLDHVMNLIGELVLGRNRMMKLSNGLEQSHESDPLVRELAETLARLDLVTSDLQTAVMKTRMLPIRKVLGKFPRMVRDLANKVGKKVELELVGEDTELDKSVIEEIGDPLVHLIRNAIDHGLETPEERRAAGKSEQGTVRLEAAQEGDRIVIKISDDGRGIPVEKIKAKALARGLVTPQEISTWARREIIDLIFQPGFSTAEKVTDVSGRGVGLDVVRTNISRINGIVEVDTDEGHGSTMTIKLPLTIAIIQALMVAVERQVFAIPLTSVVEAVKLGPLDIKTINGREVLTLRDHVLPLLRLSRMFEIPVQEKSSDVGYAVVVAVGERRFGIMVDRLHAQEEVVIKSLGDLLGKIQGVAGATITGEGKVVLILDMSELVHAMHPLGVRLSAR